MTNSADLAERTQIELSNMPVALDYAHRGWRVIPVHTPDVNGRCDCNKAGGHHHPIGKHPWTRHGVRDATTNERTIREWWNKHPVANVGIATGTASGIVALDVDPQNGGDTSLAKLEAEHGPLPPTTEARTGGGGRHLIFRSDTRLRSTTIAPGVEVKAEGRYIVAPPSLHRSGSRYEWVHHPDEVPPAPIPDWLLRTIERKTEKRIPEGHRNNTLTSMAGTMRAQGFSEDAIYEALWVKNKENCDPPLPDGEVRAIAKSIGRYPPGYAQDTRACYALSIRSGAALCKSRQTKAT